MKSCVRVLLTCLPLLLLACPGCNYIKPMMYLDIANHSGHPMENLEVTYPTGTFGLPELQDGQTHRRMVSTGTPCGFTISFEDQAGKAYTGTYDFGTKCPSEVAFEVGAGMSVSQREVRP